MGLLHPEEEDNIQNDNQQQPSEINEQPEKEERTYEKLGFWESQGDMLRAVGTEASHFFLPKSLESDYQSRTHYADNMKYLYRYGVGTAAFIGSFLFGGGEVAAAGALIKGATAIPKAAAIGNATIKLGQGIQKLANLKMVDPIKLAKAAKAGGASKKGVEAAVIAGNAVNASADIIVSDFLANMTLSRQEEGEGHFADVFGKTDNKLLSYLQTGENDSELEYRLKEAVNNTLLGIPMGGIIGGGVTGLALTRPMRTFFRGLHKSLHAASAEEARQGILDAAEGKIGLEKVAKVQDMVDEVDALRQEALETGQEVSQLIADRFPADKIEEGKAIARLRDAGEEIFPYEDGHWSIKISNWEDASKVTPEEYRQQLLAQDPDGNLGISHMNQAVESTWKQRGLVSGDGLISKTAKERTDTTNTVVDYYRDKWDLGKNKITVRYGDWTNIPDGKTTQYKNGNVLIQINKNSRDIYASLRSELEHARDFIKGEVPKGAYKKGSGVHVSRYVGDNEAEYAPSFVHKKATNRAKALKAEEAAEVETPKQNVQPEVETPVKNVEAEQLKIDFDSVKPTEDIGAKIKSGDFEFKTSDDVEAIIKHIVTNDIEVSGKTFKDVANDADKYFTKEIADNPIEFAVALSKRSPDEIDGYVREQLAAVRLLSVLKDLQEAASPRENLKILTAARGVTSFIETSKSRFGAALNYQKVINKALPVFGAEKYSDLALAGINSLADVLDTISLNFTRNKSLQQFKKEVIDQLSKAGDVFDELTKDKGVVKKLNQAIEEQYQNLKAGKKADAFKTIQEVLLTDEADKLGWYTKLCDTADKFKKVVQYGNRYVYANVLGVKSVLNQAIGTAAMSIANPTFKMIGSFLLPVVDRLNFALPNSQKATFAEAASVTKEAIFESVSKLSCLWESLGLGWQAFKKGEGLMTNIKILTEDGVEGFQPFVQMNDGKDIFQNIANIYEVNPRLMMAEDEFFNQMNYRSIVRSKCFTQAEQQLQLKGDASNLNDVLKLADELFNKMAFDESGKPLDFAAYNEAKELTFQTRLNRKEFNPRTGKMEETGKASSLIANVGSSIQQMTDKAPFLKPIALFVKTPANIADTATDSIPVFNLLKEDVRRRITSKDATVRAKVIGQAGFTAMFGLAAFIRAADGSITGSEPPDQKTKTALLKTGWKPYSFRTSDGQYTSYMGKIPVFDSFLAFAADCMCLHRDMTDPKQQMILDDIGTRLFASVMNNFFDQAGYRTNGEKLWDILNPSTDIRKRDSVIGALGQEFLPQSSNVKAIRELGKHTQTKPEGMYSNLMRGYTDLFVAPQDFKRDVFGNRVDYYGMLIAKKSDANFMQPEYAEMERLAQRGYSPSNIPHLLKKTGVPLEEFKSTKTGRSAYDAMYDELDEVKIGGKTLQESVAALIQTPRYKSLNDGIDTKDTNWSSVPYKTKKKLLDDTFQRYYNIAKRRVIAKRGDEFVDGDGKTMRERQQTVRLNMLNLRNQENLNSNITNQITKF